MVIVIVIVIVMVIVIVVVIVIVAYKLTRSLASFLTKLLISNV